MSKEKVAISLGDPAGCGAIITVLALEKLSSREAEFFVVGDKKILEAIPSYHKIKSKINLINLATPGIEKIKKGYSSKLSGQASLNYLNKALSIMEDRGIKRLVTAPLSKEAVGEVCPGFTGHTEHLARHFKIKNFAMMMTSSRLKVVLLTRHIMLSDIFSLLRKKAIVETLSLTYRSLQRQFKITKPKIVFASVNPHAGINTFLGVEEKKMIKAISEFKRQVYGPYPGDTLFLQKNLEKYDCIICAYHDQAMTPFKILALDDGINFTVGLPIVRTSPAHGVAYDLIRKNKTPSYSSMLSAIKSATSLSL